MFNQAGQPDMEVIMKDGNWVPISKAFVNHLPNNREFTEIEAIFSLQVDYDQGNSVTVSGCSKRFQWSRKRVSNFLNRVFVKILYPESTEKVKNQRGHIALHKENINGIYKEHIRLVDSKCSQDTENIKGTKEEHKRNIKGSTTNDPNPKPNNTYCKLLLKDNSEYEIKNSYVDQQKEFFPNVNMKVEFSKMSAWCFNNPAKRKTKKGATKFINNWLNKAQEKALKNNNSGKQPPIMTGSEIEEMNNRV